MINIVYISLFENPLIRHKAACQARRCETKGACVSMNFGGDGNVTILIHDSNLSDDGTVLTGIAGVHDEGRYSNAVSLAPVTFSVYFIVSLI